MNSKATAKPSPNLCLIAETRADRGWSELVTVALETAAAVTLILTPSEGTATIAPDAARPLVELAQKRACAALLLDDAAAARAIQADGVHLSWRPDIATAYDIARAELGAGSIVGADAGTSRHDAMTLGEAGADYVAFTPAAGGETDLDTQADLIAWWSDLFVVPAVAFGVETAEHAGRLAQSGADFIALRLPAGLSGGEMEEWVATAAAAARVEADAA